MVARVNFCTRNMPCLLTIPREIRDVILQDVLLASCPPDTTTDRVQPAAMRDHHGPKHVRLSTTPVVAASLALLLVSRAFALATKATIVGLQERKRLIYTLDVLLVNDEFLWPTWLCVPATVPTVDCVHVTVRTSGARSRDGLSAYYEAPRSIVPRILYSFYFLLHSFLRTAPGRISVHSLLLDFVDEHDDEDDAAKERWQTMHRLHRHALPFGVVPVAPRASWLAEILDPCISRMLTMDFRSAVFGGIVYERIGSVTIMVNGHLLRSHDLGKRIATLSFTDPKATHGHLTAPDLRLPAFWEWRDAAIVARIKAGLGVGDAVAERPAGMPSLAVAEARIAAVKARQAQADARDRAPLDLYASSASEPPSKLPSFIDPRTWRKRYVTVKSAVLKRTYGL
ncbi:hypothetical protein EXIGLDRAFT_26995 [Exidia glandulosa HHB12029]|uniref:Uncharacterized protein n=1 Tax=Exidia glandulosa HHB12029 TaxID=1314781 RepID=A0A165P8M3_EXIGL|nr:hypothetical protein EXIGLDRAFT_26995 [Exidia glandulosa HHB12029]